MMRTLESDKEEVIKLKNDFYALLQKSHEEQVQFFCTRFIFMLGEEGYEEVKDVAQTFINTLPFNERELELDHPKTTQFLTDAGHEFVSQKQKQAVFAMLDLDKNKKMALIEYLLFRYKPQILTDYYKRIGETHRIPPEDDEDELFYRTDPDTGYALLYELFGPAYGIDAQLDKLTVTIATGKEKRDKELEELHKKLESTSNVVRKAAEQRIRIMAEEDYDAVVNRQRASIKRRANKIGAQQRKTVAEYDRKIMEENTRTTNVQQEENTGPRLPPGWVEYIDDDSGRSYYFNQNTNVTQWELPM